MIFADIIKTFDFYDLRVIFFPGLCILNVLRCWHSQISDNHNQLINSSLVKLVVMMIMNGFIC